MVQQDLRGLTLSRGSRAKIWDERFNPLAITWLMAMMAATIQTNARILELNAKYIS